MRESVSAHGIFVASWLPESMEVLTNITWDGPARGAGEWKRTLRRSGTKPFSLLSAWFFLHHVHKNALCYMRVLKFGWTSTSNNLTVCTAVIKLSVFADNFVKQTAKQFLVETWARSWILPELVSFRNMEIMWIVSFCSGKGIVLAVVTRFFVSVLMWISATSPGMSIHNPRRNWHETKQFMNEYNAATVVESTVLLIYRLS